LFRIARRLEVHKNERGEPEILVVDEFCMLLCLDVSVIDCVLLFLMIVHMLNIQFAAYLSQQPMLIGITLPLWAINLHPSNDSVFVPLGVIDVLAFGGCIAGLVIAYIADTQLSQFMQM